jgi:hypothetical protein
MRLISRRGSGTSLYVKIPLNVEHTERVGFAQTQTLPASTLLSRFRRLDRWPVEGRWGDPVDSAIPGLSGACG